LLDIIDLACNAFAATATLRTKMADDIKATVPSDQLLRMAAEIVTAYVGGNNLPSGQIPDVIKTVHGALSGLVSDSSKPVTTQQKPVVPIKRSITPEYIICLEDGKKLKMLKRYLRSHYNMTPEEYRAKWNLPADYPMVAPKYSEKRSEFAKKIGLGKTRG
jgi:predicted transcriptional regulator